MAIHVFSLLCRAVTVDPFTNGLSLHEIAENLGVQTQAPPAAPGQQILLDGFDWVFLSLLRRSDDAVPENVGGRVTIVVATGEVFPGPTVRIDLATAVTTRNITKIPQLPYTVAGIYAFQMQVEINAQWQTLGEYRVNVTA